MATVSHLIYVDESGNGASGQGVNSNWVTAGLAIPLQALPDLDQGMATIRAQHFRNWKGELKGTRMPHDLLPSSSIEKVAEECRGLFKAVKGHSWIVGTGPALGGPHPPGQKPPLPKETARQFLLERVNGFLDLGNYDPDSFLLVWDISERQELNDFSGSVARFSNNYSGDPRNARLIPAVVGGLSHDWIGLQLADVFAHLAMHFWGYGQSLASANAQKASAYKLHIRPCLQTTFAGKLDGIGEKFW